MKNVLIVLFITTILIITGCTTKSQYVIVDKQDELSEIFETTQTTLNAELEAEKVLKVRLSTMQEIENPTNGEKIEMDNIPADLKKKQNTILRLRIYMGNLQFAYGVLQEMR